LRLKVLKLPWHETVFASGQLYGPSVLGNRAVFTDSTRRIVAKPWKSDSTVHHWRSTPGCLKQGRPTGAAVPLLWAHAEYIKLLRSVRDGRVFDLIPEVADRYIRNRSVLHNVQVWSIQHPSGSVQRGRTLRIHSENAFEVHSSLDNWATSTDTHSTSTNVGIDYCNIVIPDNQRVSLRFALFWTVARRWEGRDFEVACTEREGGLSQ
jgi:hypothetical protein